MQNKQNDQMYNLFYPIATLGHVNIISGKYEQSKSRNHAPAVTCLNRKVMALVYLNFEGAGSYLRPAPNRHKDMTG